MSAAPPPPPPPPLSPPPPAAEPASPPKGYLSEQAKRTFTITTGVLGVVFFLAQFLLPMLIMMVMMPGFVLTGFGQRKEYRADRAVAWNGRVWLVSGPHSMSARGPFLRGAEDSPTVLLRADMDEDDPVEVATLELEDPYLLAGKDRLWVISPEAVATYKDGRLEMMDEVGERLGEFGPPFMHRGRPAVIEKRPDGHVLKVFEGGAWRKQRDMNLKTAEADLGRGEVRVLPVGPVLHVFYKPRYGQTVYHCEGLPGDAEADDPWQAVTAAAGPWAAVEWQGRPTVVFAQGRRAANPTVLAYHYADGEWQASGFGHRAGFTEGLGACAVGDDGLVLALRSPFGGARLVAYQGGEETATMRMGSGFPFPRAMMVMMFFPHVITMVMPIILAVVLTAQMRKHRVCEYAGEAGTAPFASLARRAVAQGVDAVILGGPTAAAYVAMSSSFDDMFSPVRMLSMFGLIFAGLAWALVMLFVYSAMEGRSGRTPGKWLTGIRVVGTDLRPCGFGRALIRNLLKFADGFFNFLVGILLVALTENWQRVGDLAARTIVIRDSKRRLRPCEARSHSARHSG